MKKCKSGYYYCNTDKKCKPIPRGYRVGYGGYLRKEKDDDDSKSKSNGNGNGNGNGSHGNGNGGNGSGGNGGGGNGGGMGEEITYEAKMTEKEKKKREEIVMSMKKKKKDFEDRYGEDGKSVMYATATKLAMGEGSLRKWFKGSKSKDGKGGWVNVVTGGTCASDEPGEGTPKCVSSSKRASMTKAERLSAARRKKKADPGQQSKSGAAKPTYVSTDSPRKKKKMKESKDLTTIAKELDKASKMHKSQANRVRKHIKDMHKEEKQPKNCGCGKDPCITYGKKKKKKSHDCASKVEHKQYGVGDCIKEMHTLDSTGNVTHYDVMFEHGIEKNVFVGDLNVLVSEMHEHVINTDKNKELLEMEEEKRKYPNPVNLKKLVDKLNKNPLNKNLGVKKIDIDTDVKTEEAKSLFSTPGLDKLKKIKDYKNNADKVFGRKPIEKAHYEPEGETIEEGIPIAVKAGGIIAGHQLLKLVDRRFKKMKQNNIKKEEIVLEADKKGKGSGTKDACYHKVKSRYSVWPSAYASGALVKCRKKGAANWGNSRKEDVEYEKEYITEIDRELTTAAVVGGKVISKGIKAATNLIKNASKISGQKGNIPGGPFKTQYVRGGPGYQIQRVNKYGVQPGIDPNSKVVTQPTNLKIDTTKGKSQVKRKDFKDKNFKPRFEEFDTSDLSFQQFMEKCWKGYEKKGMKTMFGKRYPNCVKKEETVIEHHQKDENGKVIEHDLPPRPEEEIAQDLAPSSVEEGAAWTRKAGKNKSGGLNEKGRKSYERENPGSDLKAPSKKVGNKRRASFCARMRGMKKKLTSAKTARDPDSRINKSLRAWNC